ncbi:MAG: hypothetical protein KatS3mg053_1148 [Candidatus Roseilinea sp.]|nr:MAG: hypothetical protein KatS3mg053_1148 [Candidatus Roseilinea sp.]
MNTTFNPILDFLSFVRRPTAEKTLFSLRSKLVILG